MMSAQLGAERLRRPGRRRGRATGKSRAVDELADADGGGHGADGLAGRRWRCRRRRKLVARAVSPTGAALELRCAQPAAGPGRRAERRRRAGAGSARPDHGMEGVPGGVLLGHVVGGGRPPRGRALVATVATGSGMDEDGSARVGDGGEQRQRPASAAAGDGEPIGGQAEAGSAVGERLAHDARPPPRRRAPTAWPPTSRTGTEARRGLLPGGDHRQSVACGKALDAHRGRQRDECTVHIERVLTGLQVVVARIDCETGLAREIDAPAIARPTWARGRRAPLEHAQDRLRPEVLVYVERVHRGANVAILHKVSRK